MANEQHLAILRQGVETWNQWRESHPPKRPDLSGAYLRGMVLAEVNFSWADLRGADLIQADLRAADLSKAILSGAYLSRANLRWADLSEAHLSRAHFQEANLHRANLSRASLLEANLRGADLSEADLRGARFESADIGWTVFGDTDLSVVAGLESVRHSGPSTIGVDTIYRSGGNIPESFLRGAGVPDDLITFIASLVGTPIQFYSCFISYSNKDEDFAKRLYADLRSEQVRCWFAPEDMKRGRMPPMRRDRRARARVLAS